MSHTDLHMHVQEAEAAAAEKVKQEAEERRAAVIKLSKTVAELPDLFKLAIHMLLQYTSAGAAYAGVPCPMRPAPPRALCILLWQVSGNSKHCCPA